MTRTALAPRVRMAVKSTPIGASALLLSFALLACRAESNGGARQGNDAPFLIRGVETNETDYRAHIRESLSRMDFHEVCATIVGLSSADVITVADPLPTATSRQRAATAAAEYEEFRDVVDGKIRVEEPEDPILTSRRQRDSALGAAIINEECERLLD